ncbi:ATP-dependent Clp protease proteolytic subunit [bacterium]|jgi:ATP-dependent protease ClpP protease subunit|nr:ATP-dependent Clp protease proteolytic subunit [bacterium]
MTLQQIRLSLEDDQGKIELNGEINEALALGLEGGLQTLFGYYKYERVTLRINSPGGMLVALRHILEYVQFWRERGHRIETEASFCAASAAAMLMTFGDVGTRTVHRHTHLLFHHTRIGGTSSAITAGGANYLASLLKNSDAGMLKQAVNHIISNLGGIDAHRDEGLARCELLLTKSESIANALGLHDGGRQPRWLKPLCNMYRDSEGKKNAAGYFRYLEKRFDQDSTMDLREAYALCLLDQIHGISELKMLQLPEDMKAHALDCMMPT